MLLMLNQGFDLFSCFVLVSQCYKSINQLFLSLERLDERSLDLIGGHDSSIKVSFEIVEPQHLCFKPLVKLAFALAA